MGAVLVLKQDILEKFLKLFGQNGLKLGIHNNNNKLSVSSNKGLKCRHQSKMIISDIKDQEDDVLIVTT